MSYLGAGEQVDSVFYSTTRLWENFRFSNPTPRTMTSSGDLNSPPVVRTSTGKEYIRSKISHGINNKLSVARMTTEEVFGFVHSAENPEQKVERIRLIAAMNNSEPTRHHRTGVEHFRKEEREAQKFGANFAAQAFDKTLTKPASVERFFRRVREHLARLMVQRSEREERLLAQAVLGVCRGSSLDDAVGPADLKNAMATLDIHLSAATAEEVVRFVSLAGDGGSDGGDGNDGLRMRARRFVALVLEPLPPTLGTVMAHPSSARAAAAREAEHHRFLETSHQHTSSIDHAPESARNGRASGAIFWVA